MGKNLQNCEQLTETCESNWDGNGKELGKNLNFVKKLEWNLQTKRAFVKETKLKNNLWKDFMEVSVNGMR